MRVCHRQRRFLSFQKQLQHAKAQQTAAHIGTAKSDKKWLCNNKPMRHSWLSSRRAYRASSSAQVITIRSGMYARSVSKQEMWTPSSFGRPRHLPIRGRETQRIPHSSSIQSRSHPRMKLGAINLESRTTTPGHERDGRALNWIDTEFVHLDIAFCAHFAIFAFL
eukprot:6201564-Pleurochrysis_carterae.AAC.2